MAIKVNLLPPELAAGGSLLKISKVIKSLNLILLSGFLVFGLALAGFFIASSIQLESLVSRENELKDQISSLKATEQKMVILKDRIGKIKSAKALKGINPGLTAVSPILSQMASDSSLSELTIDSQKVELSVNFRSRVELSNFLGNVKNSISFKSVVLTSFGFNPSTGYLLTLRLMPKS